jgi:hypothetical protein
LEEDTDTIVVPAREDGFQAVFLGENRWYAIEVGSSKMKKIKYIAAYRVAPISAITHLAPVKSFEVWEEYEALKKVEPWRKGTKFVVNFSAAAGEIGPISLVRRGPGTHRGRSYCGLRRSTRCGKAKESRSHMPNS